MARDLLSVLRDERTHKIDGGIYNKLQVDFAYNSNHIEGSCLTHEQTRYIFETHSIVYEDPRTPVKVDDVVETLNHFKCFDYIIDSVEQPITEEYIKELHRCLKTGTLSSESAEAVVGDYKKYANFAGDTRTVLPQNVGKEIYKLLHHYSKIDKPSLYDVIAFHATFEKIHPFYDGNGRVGRLVMFKECIKNDIVPFIINDNDKGYYYRNLKQWQDGGEREGLIDTCLSMQDNMKKDLDYFDIEYNGKEMTAREVLKQGASKGYVPPIGGDR